MLADSRRPATAHPPVTMRLSVCLLIAGLAAAPAATPAAAQAPDPATLDRITVSARHDTVAAERPEAVSVLAAEAIARVAATHASELLARVPGAWISRGSGQEQLTAIRSPVLTGAGACGAFLFLEDGVPIRPAGFCNVNQLFELNTEQAGAVEVLRGPGAAVHGSNALHGVINVRPRAPADAPARAFAIEAGPERYRRGQFTLADADGAAHWRIDGYGVSTDSFRPDEGYDQQKLSAQLAFPDSAGGWRWLLSAANLNQETAGFVTGERAYRDGRRLRNENPEAFRDGRAVRLQGRAEWQLDGGASFAFVPYARRDSLRFIQHFTPGKPLEDTGSRSLGAQAMWRHEGAWRRQWGVDVELARGEVRQFQPRALTDSTPFQNAIRPAGVHYDYAVDATSLALFGEVERALSARATLFAGARAERLRYRYDNRAADGNLRADGTPCGFGGCLYNRPADRSDRFDDISAQLGLRHALDARWSASGRVARAFRFPQAAELYRLQRGQDVADLRAETLDGIELGLHRTGTFALDLSAYAYAKRNVILRDAQGFNLSDGRTTHRGIEAAWRWDFADGWRLAGNAAYAVQRYAFDRAIAGGETIVRGNEVDTAPRTLGGLRLGHDHARFGKVELEWQHLGGYWLDAANTQRYGGHDLLHLRWSRDVGDVWRLSLRAMNLTDRRYAERADLAFGEFRYFPGAGRSLFAAVEYRPVL